MRTPEEAEAARERRTNILRYLNLLGETRDAAMRAMLAELLDMGCEWALGVDNVWSEEEQTLFARITGASHHGTRNDWKLP